jgi:hypothetical protein
MFGCNLYQERQRDPSLASIVDMHMTQVHGTLMEMDESDDPLSFAQAHLLMSLACFYNREFGLAKRFFRRSAGTVQQHDIRFVPRRVDDTNPLPPFSEEVLERISFLCELIDCSMHVPMLTGKPIEPLTDLHNQFKQELKVSSRHR